MYPINKYLFDTIFGGNNNLYQDFMCSVDTEYIDAINILKCSNTIKDIRETIQKLLSIVVKLIDKDYEMVYYCNLALLIDKKETNIKFYSEYIKMIINYDKTNMGLYQVN